MSSETSTSRVRVKPDTTEGQGQVRRDSNAGSVRLQPDHGTDQTDPGLQPWQFFVLAALGCATAVTFVSRGQGPTVVILLGILMGTAALVGYAALRTFRPLVTAEDDRTVMVGQRTRVALEREKLLTLRSIKELEFDRAMGRLSDEDWKEMSGRLRSRVARLIRQLDAGTGYREQIERDLDARLKPSRSEESDGNARLKPSRSEESDGNARLKPSRYEEVAEREDGAESGDSRSAKASAERTDRSAKALAERVCASCATANDADAKFCKNCGGALSH
jgi:hypothetical protein